MQATAEAIIHALTEGGYRITRPRRAVIEVLCATPELLDPIELLDRAKAHYPRVGLATVYRTLDVLEQNGLARRISLNGKTRVVACGNLSLHYHLICVRCGVVVEMHDADTGRALERSAFKHGFALEHSPVEIRGVCAKCR